MQPTASQEALFMKIKFPNEPATHSPLMQTVIPVISLSIFGPIINYNMQNGLRERKNRCLSEVITNGSQRKNKLLLFNSHPNVISSQSIQHHLLATTEGFHNTSHDFHLVARPFKFNNWNGNNTTMKTFTPEIHNILYHMWP